MFKEAGGYLDVHSCNDFPRDRKQKQKIKKTSVSGK